MFFEQPSDLPIFRERPNPQILMIRGYILKKYHHKLDGRVEFQEFCLNTVSLLAHLKFVVWLVRIPHHLRLALA
jgi:hypothetical protein